MTKKGVKYVAILFLLNVLSILGASLTSQETTTVDSELLSTTPEDSETETTPQEPDAETTPQESEAETTAQDDASSTTEPDDSEATTTEDAVTSTTAEETSSAPPVKQHGRAVAAAADKSSPYYGTKVHPFPPYKYIPNNLDTAYDDFERLKVSLGYFKYEWLDSRPDLTKEYIGNGSKYGYWLGGPHNMELKPNSPLLACLNNTEGPTNSTNQGRFFGFGHGGGKKTYYNGIPLDGGKATGWQPGGYLPSGGYGHRRPRPRPDSSEERREKKDTRFLLAYYPDKTDYECNLEEVVATTAEPSTESPISTTGEPSTESPTTQEQDLEKQEPTTSPEVAETTEVAAESTSPSDEESTTRDSDTDYNGVDLTSSEEARRLNRTAEPF